MIVLQIFNIYSLYGSSGTILSGTSQCDKKGKGEKCEVNIVFNKQTSVWELTLVWGWRRGKI